MSDENAATYKTPLIIAAAIVAIYGIFGWLDVKNYAQAGWATDGNNTVTQVLPGSPAEAGGLMVGDFLVSLDGIATSDSAAQARRARPEVGETWEFVVLRDGSEMTLSITFAEPVAQRKLIAHASQIVGFSFLLFGMLAYLQNQSSSTFALALMGVLISPAFLAGPYFESYMLRTSINAVLPIAIWMGLATILYFVLNFPNRSAFMEKKNAGIILFAPALALGIFITFLIVAQPEATSALNTMTGIVTGLTIAVYMISALVIAFKKYRAADAGQRASSGLNLVGIGTIAALALPAIATVVSVISPQTVLPGVNFYFLTLALIPITWSMAVRKSGAAT